MPHKLKLLHGMIKMISSKFDGMGVRGRIPCAKKKTDAPARRVESCVEMGTERNWSCLSGNSGADGWQGVSNLGNSRIL